MNLREVFAANLKALRRTKGLSQEELAFRANIDRTYVSLLERCVYSVSIDVMDRLAFELGVDAAELLKNPPAVGQKARVEAPGISSGRKRRRSPKQQT